MYPAYNSYKVMQTNTMVENIKVITYWVVFSVFTVTEQVADGLVGDKLPYYWQVKVIFIIWLVSPLTMGYYYLFSWVVQPLMFRLEKKFDNILHQVRKRIFNETQR